VANSDQVKALISSHAEGDDARFYAVAMQVAAQAARSGHTKFAQELRDLVDKAKARGNVLNIPRSKPIPMVQPRGELAGVLTASYPKSRLSDMALDHVVQARIDRVLTEQRQRGRVHEHGFVPIRKLLLVGPPGTGKTMTAAVLAGELGLPLFTIQLDGLITKFMGETAAKLRLIFDAIRETRAVYLFDEFDALGTERALKNDVGEIRRVLTSFLLFLEQDDSDGITVCATNYPKLLDRALFRRFDMVIEYQLPTGNVAEQVMKTRLALLNTSSMDWQVVIEASQGLSHGEIARGCEDTAKNVILGNRTTITTQDLLDSLTERRTTHS